VEHGYDYHYSLFPGHEQGYYVAPLLWCMALCIVHSYQPLLGYCIFLPAKILLERIYKLKFTALISRFQILEFTAQFMFQDPMVWSVQTKIHFGKDSEIGIPEFL